MALRDVVEDLSDLRGWGLEFKSSSLPLLFTMAVTEFQNLQKSVEFRHEKDIWNFLNLPLENFKFLW
jgi:hypothetical protein